MPYKERVVAVGLLTRSDLVLLGSSLNQLWPVDQAPCFTGLLDAIDQADRQLRATPDATDKNRRAKVPKSDPVR